MKTVTKPKTYSVTSYKSDEELRKQVSYKTFNDLADKLDKNPTKGELLEIIWSAIEYQRGWKYRTIAQAAYEAMELVKIERKW